MAQLVVRQLDDAVKEKLGRRARRHGRSTEEEVREILRNAVRSEGGIRTSLGSRIAGITAARRAVIATRNVRHFEGLGPKLTDPWSN